MALSGEGGWTMMLSWSRYSRPPERWAAKLAAKAARSLCGSAREADGGSGRRPLSPASAQEASTSAIRAQPMRDDNVTPTPPADGGFRILPGHERAVEG